MIHLRFHKGQCCVPRQSRWCYDCTNVQEGITTCGRSSRADVNIAVLCKKKKWLEHRQFQTLSLGSRLAACSVQHFRSTTSSAECKGWWACRSTATVVSASLRSVLLWLKKAHVLPGRFQIVLCPQQHWGTFVTAIVQNWHFCYIPSKTIDGTNVETVTYLSLLLVEAVLKAVITKTRRYTGIFDDAGKLSPTNLLLRCTQVHRIHS